MLISLASSLARLAAASCRRQTGFMPSGNAYRVELFKKDVQDFRSEISAVELPPRVRIMKFNSAKQQLQILHRCNRTQPQKFFYHHTGWFRDKLHVLD